MLGLFSAVLGVSRAGAATAPAGLDVVTVLPAAEHGVAVVAQVTPAPLGPLGADAVSVTAEGRSVPASVAPAFAAGAPVALVVDASQGGAPTLPQTLGGAAGMLLRLPTDTPVTVVADRSPPQVLTSTPASPAGAISALTSVKASGSLATPEALAAALQQLARRAGERPVVVLTTSGPPPQDADTLVERFRSAHALLAVVGTDGVAQSWSGVAARTGGLAVAADPQDAATAFDQLLDTLQARSVVTFTPPPSARTAQVVVQSAGARLATTVDLAGLGTAGATASGAAGPEAGGRSAPANGWLWVLFGVVLVAAAVLAARTLARRRGRRAPAVQPGRHSERASRQPRALSVVPGRVSQSGAARPQTPRAPANSAEQDAGDSGGQPAAEDGGALPPGVRVFDPQSLTELDPVTHEPGGAPARGGVGAGPDHDEDGETEGRGAAEAG